MEIDPHDQDIIKLLTTLKDVRGEYPEKLLVARRQSYLKRISELEVGMNGGNGTGHVAKSPKPPRGLPAAILETALIVAIVAEASVMTYFYRDKVADFFRALTTNSKAQEITPAPVVPTSEKVQGTSPAPAIASTVAASPTEITETPTSTPIPEVAGENSTTPGVDSSSAPNGNNGHHYGQTPKPERTKENSGNNNKPPKEKPTKKPTKSK